MPAPVAKESAPPDYEEKYLRLRDEHTNLQQRCNEQEDVIRRMNTKLSVIESNLKTRQKLDQSGVLAVESSVMLGSPQVQRRAGQPRNRENEDLITELYRVNAELQRKNMVLEGKNRKLTQELQKSRKGLEHARRTKYLRKGSQTPVAPAAAAPVRPSTAGAERAWSRSPVRSASPVRVPAADSAGKHDELEKLSSSKLMELVEKLRRRLVSYEHELAVIREEKLKLLEAKIKTEKGGPKDAAETAVAYTMAGKRARVTAESEEITRLNRELRDAHARLQLLQTRHDHLDAKTKAQSEIQQGSIDQLEEYNERIRDLRRALQKAQREREAAEMQAARLPDLEEKNRELRELNDHLEVQVTKLCESPFISEAFQKQERANRLVELERQDRQQKLKIEHLQETVESQHKQLLAVQKGMNELRNEKDGYERQLDELRVRCRQTEAGAQLLTDKMKLYSTDDGVDLEELERALAIVRRRSEATAQLDFLESTGDGEDSDTVPGLKRKLQLLQVSNLNLTMEVERAERMLKAQTAINKDLHLELEELSRRSTIHTKELEEKLEGFEALALKRLQRVHYLEAQVKQSRYNVHKPLALAHGETGAGMVVAGAEEGIMDEIAAGDFGPDENLVEVWIVAAELAPGALAMGASSFIIVDFFDYESQATPFVLGSNPRYDFATSYKVTVDDFFLSYLASEVLILELNQTRQLDYDMMARAEVPLYKLLESRPSIILPKQPLISVKDGSVSGTLHVEMRLALPIAEVYKLFLQRHPEEKACIGRLAAERGKGGGGLTRLLEDATRLQNELEVSVVQVTGLPHRTGLKVPPCAYVHYQVMSFREVFTPVGDQGNEVTFGHITSFPVTTDAKLLRFLRRYRIAFTVIDYLDDVDEGGEMTAEGLIGRVEVPVTPLADGDAVAEAFELVNENGKPVGKIRVSIRWRFPLKTGRNTGPNTLIGAEVAEILSAFSPQKDGLVRYRDFVRYCDPPANVREALRKAHAFLMRAEQTQGLSNAAMLEHITGVRRESGVEQEAFRQGLESLNMGLAPDELIDLYDYLDARRTGQVDFNAIVRLLSPPSSTMASVVEKVRSRFQDLCAQGKLPLSIFEAVDEGKTGRLTRLQFKEALVDCGFVLVDDPLVTPGIVPQVERQSADSGVGFEEELGQGGELRAGGGWTWEATRRTGKTKAEELRKKRADFEKRIRELEESAAKAAPGAQDPGSDTPPGTPSRGPRSPSPVRETNVHAQVQQSHTVVKDSGARVGRFTNADEAATRIQAKYRSYQTRRFLNTASFTADNSLDRSFHFDATSASTLSQVGMPVTVIQQQEGLSERSLQLLDAEEALGRALRATQGVMAPPDLQPTFTKLDRQGKGSVNRQQFAHAIRQHSALLPILPHHLRAFMDYFDTSNDGSSIDYREFLVFADYQLPELHPGVAAMRKMMLHSGSLELCRKYDVDGVGLISVPDFLEALRESGYGYLGASVLRSIPTLFDYRQVIAPNGQILSGVDYQNFVEYVLDQDASLNLRDVETKLRLMIRQLQQQDPATLLRGAFARFDATDTGEITQQQFAQTLAQLGLKLTDDELNVLFSRVDSSMSGYIRYYDFIQFIDTPPSPRPISSIVPHEDFDEASLQAKGANLLMDAGNRGVDVSGMGKVFGHYDWRREGKLPASLFFAAAGRAGFTYTTRELEQIARHFSMDTPVGLEYPVNYRKFLAWLMGNNTTGQRAASGGGNDEKDLAVVIGQLREARKEWVKDGVDYRKVIERYDDDLQGTLSRMDLRKALRELKADLEDGDINQLLQRFNSKGRVAYLELLHIIQPPSEGSWEVEEDLRWMIRRRFQYWLTGRLKEPFRHFSMSKAPFFTENEFADGLRALGFKLPPDQEHILFRKLDLDGGGKISYQAFVTFVRDPNYRDVEVKLSKRIKDLKVGLKEARRVLKVPDTGNDDEEDEDGGSSGLIPMREFKRSLEKLGLDMPTADLERVASRYASTKDEKKVDVELFLRYVKDLEEPESSSESEDEGTLVDKVINRIKRIIKAGEEKGVAPEKAFEHFDSSGTGVVDPDDFVLALDRLKIIVTPLECKQVMKKLGAKKVRDGSLLLEGQAFLEALGVKSRHDEAKGADDDAIKTAKDWEVVAQEFRSQLRRRPRALCALREALQQLDKKGRKKVSREDVRYALDQVDITLGSKQLRRLMDHFSADGDESCVDYGKLLGAFTPSENPIVAKIRDKLADVKDGEKRLRKLLAEYDRGDKGAISRRELRLCLEDVGVELSLDDTKSLMKMFETADNELLMDTVSFSDAVFGQAKSSEEQASDPVGNVLHTIRAALKKEGQKPTCLRPKLERVDERAKGYVTARQFERVLDTLELDLDQKQLALLTRAFDRAKDGNVHYMTFCERLEGSQSPSHGEAGDEAEDTMEYLMELLQRAGGKGIDILECFEHFDLNCDGNIDEEELQKGLQKLDIRLSKKQTQEVMEKFEGRRPGLIRYKEFVMAVRKSGGAGGRDIKSPSHKKNDKGDRDDKRRIKLSRTVSMVLATQLPPTKKVRRALEELDRRATGKLSRQAFRGALGDMSLDLGDGEWRSLLAELDRDDKGYIVWGDFLIYLDGLKESEEHNGSEEKEEKERPKRGRESSADGVDEPYEGTRKKRGLMADEAVEVSVHEVRVADRSVAKEVLGSDMFVKYKLAGWERETSKHTVERSVVELQSVVTFPIPQDSRSADDLARDLKRGMVVFVVCTREKGQRVVELGTGRFDLRVILDDRKDAVEHSVQLCRDGGEKIGSVVLTVKAYEVLTSFRRG